MDSIVLDQLLQEIIVEAKSAGIPISNHICPTVTINQRPKRRLGCCKLVYVAGGHQYIIELSGIMMDSPIESIRNVLGHEILHTCDNCMNHGHLWQSYAGTMNQKYGYNIRRTSSHAEYGVNAPKTSRAIRYEIICNNCGMVYERERRSNVVKFPSKYSCSKCGGTLRVREL